jgi:phosphate transport system permease protein
VTTPGESTRDIARRRRNDVLFQALALTVLCVALASLAALIAGVWIDGASRLSWDFLTGFPSRNADQAGIWHALTGSLFVIAVTALLARSCHAASNGGVARRTL